MNKIVVFSYKRDSLPHSEYQVRKQLEKFLVDDSSSFVITTATASIFLVVRAFCHKNNVKLSASYEELSLKVDKDMRMSEWSKCPDFEAPEDDLMQLLEPAKP